MSSPSVDGPPELRRKSTFDHFKSSSIHAVPEIVKSKKLSYKVAWALVLICSFSACFVHLFLLLKTFLVSPNAISISYVYKRNIEFPTIQICAPSSRFLSQKLLQTAISKGELELEYLYAIELGLGVVNEFDDLSLYTWLNLTAVQQQYKLALDRHGSIVAAANHFYSRFMLGCQDDVFVSCQVGSSRGVNCCTLFQRVFTIQGPCFASKPGAIHTANLGVMGSLRLVLSTVGHAQFEMDLHRSGELRLTQGAAGYRVSINDGLDQTLSANTFHLYMKKNDFAHVQLRQKRRILMDDEPGKCVQTAELGYFLNYTLGNCQWERNFFDKLYLLDFACQLPIVELLNSSVKLANPCNLEDVQRLYSYYPDTTELITKSLLNVLDPRGEKLEVPFCRFPDDPVSDLPPCTTGHILTFTNATWKDIPLNSYPHVWSVFARLDTFGILDQGINPCPLLCDFVEHAYTHIKDASEEAFFNARVSARLQFDSHEVEQVQEVPRQSISEYISMVGGNFGLWTGASLISLAHLLALIIKALHSTKPAERIISSRKSTRDSNRSKSASPPPKPRRKLNESIQKPTVANGEVTPRVRPKLTRGETVQSTAGPERKRSSSVILEPKRASTASINSF